MQNINLRSTFPGTNQPAKPMIEQGRSGSIINVSSIATESKGPAGLAYSTSKTVVFAMTRWTSIELGKYGIRCNTIITGTIISPLTQCNINPEGMIRNVSKLQSIPIAGIPELIAPSYAFLASDKSHFATGTSMVIDEGGSAMDLNLYSCNHTLGNAIMQRASLIEVDKFDFGSRNNTTSLTDMRVLEELQHLRHKNESKRCVLITGTCRRLGRELCREFARLAHQVIGCSCKVKDVVSTRAELGAQHRIDQLDITNDAALREWTRNPVKSGLVADLALDNATVTNEKKSNLALQTR